MSVPLDNLYHWVEGLLPDPAVLYVFRPHGSKKISDLNWLRCYNSPGLMPSIIMHDQEPLDWNSYNSSEDYLNLERWKQSNPPVPEVFSKFNLKSLVLCQTSLIYDKSILVHSEKNSPEVILYEKNEFICIHYWSHALIARDWYRFAEYDTRLCQNLQPKNKFLIYCRDWSDRREYRLKFLELLAKNELQNNSLTSVMHTNSKGVHFSQHKFLNSEFELVNPEIITQFKNNNFCSTSSADYNYADFVNTEVSVVLETVFDDSRIHLTEKTLRPIACGHPFILAAGPGSLEYIRSYGFKTFAPWIDESYDLESDSLLRLEKIIKSMKQIQDLQGKELENFSQEIKNIAEFNKKHFFSSAFFHTIKDELKNNFDRACFDVKNTTGKYYMSTLKFLKSQNLIYQHRQRHTLFLRRLRQSYPRGLSNPAADPPV
jgi:hypothetical protein